ncbi:DUF4440 domain-containing protein [Microbulbifer sp. TYP-18]|uniref:nuclear transport factor 2 family protein n=1 Tax=Microbulbifer sp. TYP-18 TaxID=3230024 RepID=UPI0034C66296
MEELGSVIITLEEYLFRSSTRASTAELQRLISDDFIEIGAAGNQFGKSKVLSRLPSEDAPEITADNYEVRRLSDECVQLLYRATLKRGDSEPSYSKRCSIWTMSSGSWQMWYHQGTPCQPF